MERVTNQQLAMMPIEFKLNGQTVVGRPDEPIIETAKKHGVEIPHLCHGGNQRSDGNCRSCVVEIKGERTLAPSCCRYPAAGMEVTTNSPRATATPPGRTSSAAPARSGQGRPRSRACPAAAGSIRPAVRWPAGNPCAVVP